MLLSLHIENVAVIRRADVDFERGLCALTGETGAGKSLIIDSIGALTGSRVTRDLIRAGEDKARITALFGELDGETVHALAELGVEVEDGELMLEREIYRDGKSRARIGGRTVTQSMLREAGALLINIHGQSDNQKLMQKSSHQALLDAYARNDEAVQAYRELYAKWRAVKGQIEEIRTSTAERIRTREMLEYQIKDIDAAKLHVGEEEKLVYRRDRLLYQEKIEKNARMAVRVLTDSEKATVVGLCDRATSALEAISSVVPECDELLERLGSIRAEAEDIAERVRGFCDEDMVDPTAEIDRIEGRLDTINRLGRKYGEGVDAILAFRENAAVRLGEIETADDRVVELERKMDTLNGELTRAAAALTATRRKAAAELSASVAESLAFLDMPKVRFEAVCESLGQFGVDGADDIEFLISANPGEPLAPMIRTASGGELSRIMLAIRSVLNEKYGVPTAIYDEVDAGISGRTARKVGIKLAQISHVSQVICVTHSAQIASLADAHYVIEKREADGRAETSVRLISDEERVDEVARILGGIDITDSQRIAARELIAERESY